MIGEVFVHPDAVSGGADETSDPAFAAWFARNRWGRYVILFRETDGAVRAIFRDPSGALSAHAWSAHGVRVVASSTPDWLVALAPPDISFDWVRVRELVETPFELAGPSPLDGLVSVAPGALQVVGGPSTALWTPARIAASGSLDAGAARRQLRERLDVCVTALAGRRALGMELSGGLDSSIVAGAVRALGLPVSLALNTRAHEPETDERRFARPVAERIGASLTERLREETPWSAEAFEATAGDPLPSQNGRDLANDLAVSNACRETGVEVLLTGKGGDALFFQTPTPLVFADLWWTQPFRSLFSAHLPGVARWTRSSTWSLLRAAIESRRKPAPDDLPPAKRLQIGAISSGLAYYSACRRLETVDMVHPLMAQPLVEWGLRTPVPLLAPAGRERGLAREAFADRIPAAVATRRDKADYAACFNRQAARNLPFLRAYLLDGRLAAEGVLDRAAMEAHLNEDALRWRGGAAQILAAVSVEAWVRRWMGRV
ncbi:asparagine synthase-related protein [Brevundimonas viscosa]|uniref:Asparagine synthase (Glutamine-hydrolysing) n=1 Tax=Brevundimonas viscosa TaxID=871741 RepID=A0A1I6SP22_9CAUL|nr:asparagine synthase-related protein [Brevundimonas viscosa]SFS78548.1 asparagine synthase (glutamine-hydrolysing) [Brevundimonas viscosa]